ncbi:hypothetical protein QAD02_006119 [Eretmocerus hayati]|uniref:Uncharacterized protein n=1 Tax=Eretmocerus hayati TaxID=131215 RepID=A0ACC2N088_9HYME|nr:hypothetical protein QAD02_006119 [Eretmocerus hayati]
MTGVSTGLNQLTIELDRAVEETKISPEDNFVLSPVSLQMALAMVLLASKGKTSQDIMNVLNMNKNHLIAENSEFAHLVLSSLIRNFDHEKRGNQSRPLTRLASGIFVQSGFPLREQFRVASERLYRSQVYNINFQQNSTGAQHFINKWVKAKTLDKISHVLNDPPDPNTDLMILSTMYFKGEWEKKFDVAEDRMPFNIEHNMTVYVDMLYQNSEFPYYADNELKIVGLPYRGREVMMYMILPFAEGTAGLRRLKSDLDTEKLEALISKMEDKEIVINLPKMELSSSSSLKDILKTLGLSTIFDPEKADFSLLAEASNKSPVTVSTTNHPIESTVQESTESPYLEPSTIDSSTMKIEEFNVTHHDIKSTPSFALLPPKFSINNGTLPPYLKPSMTTSTTPTPPFTISEGCKTLNKIDLYTYRCEDEQFIYILENLPYGHHWHKIFKFKNRRRRNTESINSDINKLRRLESSTNPGLYVSDIIQAVKITVDEKGSEAAASSVVEIGMRFGFTDFFIADRPFLLFIRHVKTKSIWFWGSVNNPQPSYPTRTKNGDD